MALGPLMLDIDGCTLTAQDREVLRLPAVGGLILFDRNYESPAQLTELLRDVKALRQPSLLVAVDQEGGRVQRFRKGFARLPALARLGEQFDRNAEQGRELSENHGWVMAAELRALGIDISFAPVLDLRSCVSSVIGERAFHGCVDATVKLARSMVKGMRRAGMQATGKHFPGHGTVKGDSHFELPVDKRDLVDISASDMRVFARLVQSDIAGLMMAHVFYPAVDSQSACFSERWIREQLRSEIGFSGAVFSDDLSMQGAKSIGPVPLRAQRAIAAGCDMVLVCNDRERAVETALALRQPLSPPSAARLARMRGTGAMNWHDLVSSRTYREARSALEGLEPQPELDLR